MRVCAGPECVEKLGNKAELCPNCLQKLPGFLRELVVAEKAHREGVLTQETLRICISALFHRAKTGINPIRKQVEKARAKIITEREKIIENSYGYYR